ncbi:MAG: hypothetical protein ACR2N6_07945 [Miltoncostaeaceae bacterium]
MSDDAETLRDTTARLEEVTTELASSEVGAERAAELAQAAMELSAEVAALVARVLRPPAS